MRQWHTRRPEFLSAAEPGATLVVPGFTVRPCVDVEALEFALPFDDDRCRRRCRFQSPSSICA
jgi:hypothetical protein